MCAVFRLPFGTVFEAAVYSVNADNVTGGVSDTIRVATTEAPSAPSAIDLGFSSGRRLSSAVTATGGAIALSWTSPMDTGGVPIENFRVYMTTAQDYNAFGRKNLTVIRDVASAHVEVAGLTQLTGYELCISAVNQFPYQFEGPLSCMSLSTTAATPPSAPTLFSVSVVSLGRAFATWMAPYDAGGTIVTSYLVYYADVLTPSIWVERSVAVLNASYAGLNSVSFDFRVVRAAAACALRETDAVTMILCLAASCERRWTWELYDIERPL